MADRKRKPFKPLAAFYLQYNTYRVDTRNTWALGDTMGTWKTSIFSDGEIS